VSLEQELRAIGVELPAEPDVQARVLARLERPRRRPWLVPAVVALAVVASLFAIPQTRAAILRVLHIGSVEIRREETEPRATPGPLPLGTRVSLEQARDAARIELAVPRDYEAIYADGPFVTFVLRPRVWLLEFRGSGFPILRKEVGPGTRIDETSVGGAPAMWVEGPHVVFRGPQRRLAGNVLIWTRSDATYRLEGALTQDEAVEVAQSLSCTSC